ncbi:hypothetical protein CSA56_07495 [candidate division KSB3 bacterium]|uniref:Uncharacterized protein n=1 Tax=candidate division KSB3 bacterium TaxID=2044937 RepID=A0A2G6KFX5_9BACT|nr:MAG: hypothetical protein CSA56_07495 [candidate division KSB3 bacterium]
MSLFAISQILTGIATCKDLISFQVKEKKHIVCCLLVSCTMISLHFIFLERWTASLLALLALTNNGANALLCFLLIDCYMCGNPGKIGLSSTHQVGIVLRFQCVIGVTKGDNTPINCAPPCF